MTDPPDSPPKTRSYPPGNAIYFFDDLGLRWLMEKHGQPHEGLDREQMLRILEPLEMPDRLLDYYERTKKELEEMTKIYLAKKKAKSSARSRSAKKPENP